LGRRVDACHALVFEIRDPQRPGARVIATGRAPTGTVAAIDPDGFRATTEFGAGESPPELSLRTRAKTPATASNAIAATRATVRRERRAVVGIPRSADLAVSGGASATDFAAAGDTSSSLR
jgi:hypothetical protein